APPSPAPARFTARFRPKLVRNAEDMLRLVEAPAEQILDARSTGRFAGTAPEPRAGLRSGHMPGARNLPYDRLLNEDGTLKDAEALRALFAEAGIDLDRPVVTSCGSGVSATVPLLALLRLGHRAGALYDGSWAEWGSRQDTPIVT
ncbi:MAG TPA: rhodanese-like domain-containing protein, partial [Alphaproteobacteria bacterium]|nr:rhodanese-like domain-containing protein [Alphaproteobacteria bacterium]